jgi:oxygen-independent coproporphyrinogen-3 oxidase
MKNRVTTAIIQTLYKILSRTFSTTSITTGELEFRNKTVALYIHFPYCDAICRYCPFSRTVTSTDMDDYLDAVISELDQLNGSGKLVDTKLSSIAFGGGTPSLIPEDKLRAIVAKISEIFSHYDSIQKTMECTPESITIERLKLFEELGFNRLTVGVQSLQQEVLDELGRKSSPDEIVEKLKLVEQNYSSPWSADMIYGFDSHDTPLFLKDLETLNSLGAHHISLFPLVNSDSKNRQTLISKQFSKMEEMHRGATEKLENLGFDSYSVEDYSKDESAQCEYQKDVWGYPQKDLLILGSGAFGIAGDVQYRKTKNRKEYLAQVVSGEFPIDRYTPINPKRTKMVSSLMGLHFNRTNLTRSFLFVFLELVGIIVKGENEYALTERGRFITSLLWAKIMLDRMIG